MILRLWIRPARLCPPLSPSDFFFFFPRSRTRIHVRIPLRHRADRKSYANTFSRSIRECSFWLRSTASRGYLNRHCGRDREDCDYLRTFVVSRDTYVHTNVHCIYHLHACMSVCSMCVYMNACIRATKAWKSQSSRSRSGSATTIIALSHDFVHVDATGRCPIYA
jgi:hypothetical protein